MVASRPSSKDESNSFRTSKRSKPLDVPSSKYPEIEEPNPVVIKRAQSPPSPTLPRKPDSRTWAATRKEKNPLTSCLTGPGRAGKYGELLAGSGGRYEGEVLAGRPHGHGRFLVPKAASSKEMVLQYEGQWVQGRREGQGTRYYAKGETYTGDWVANLRHGQGRYLFDTGNMYSGEWAEDKRTGHGTMYYKNGDIYSGTFIRDRREGLGTLYMMSRQKKYVAEYVSDAPRCGTVLEMDDADLGPLQQELMQLSLTRKLDMMATGMPLPSLPKLQLEQPSKVLAEQVAAVRGQREAASKPLQRLQAASGTLGHKEMELLRHAFTLLAGGDDAKVGLLPQQIRELINWAGLDSATPAVQGLTGQLLQRQDAGTGRISFDEFIKVVAHFQEHPEAKLHSSEQPPTATALTGTTLSATSNHAAASSLAATTTAQHMADMAMHTAFAQSSAAGRDQQDSQRVGASAASGTSVQGAEAEVAVAGGSEDIQTAAHGRDSAALTVRPEADAAEVTGDGQGSGTQDTTAPSSARQWSSISLPSAVKESQPQEDECGAGEETWQPNSDIADTISQEDVLMGHQSSYQDGQEAVASEPSNLGDVANSSAEDGGVKGMNEAGEQEVTLEPEDVHQETFEPQVQATEAEAVEVGEAARQQDSADDIQAYGEGSSQQGVEEPVADNAADTESATAEEQPIVPVAIGDDAE